MINTKAPSPSFKRTYSNPVASPFLNWPVTPMVQLWHFDISLRPVKTTVIRSNNNEIRELPSDFSGPATTLQNSYSNKPKAESRYSTGLRSTLLL